MIRCSNVIALSLAASLVACGPTRNGKICQMAYPTAYLENARKEMRSTDPEMRFGAHTVLAEDCVLRTARLLARSPDPAEVVAKAVVAQCEERIEAYAGYMREAANPHGVAEIAARDIVTGRDTTFADRAFRRMTRRALGAVVEARAGHCFD